MPTYSAFISYSRKDIDKADQIRAVLDRSELHCWLDSTNIAKGTQWRREIMRGLTQSDVVLAVVTENLPNTVAQEELEMAREMRKPIIPLIFDDTIDSGHKISRLLKQYDYEDMRSTDDFSGVVRAVRENHLCPVLALYNVKGGVGKTTIAANLAAYYYARDKRSVLAIDFDPQSNLSTAMVGPANRADARRVFGGDRRNSPQSYLRALRGSKKSVLGLLETGVAIADNPDEEFQIEDFFTTLRSTKNNSLDILVGDPHVRKMTTDFRPIDVRRAYKGFARFIGQCRRKYDVIIIDMNPSISHLSKCALETATHVLSPVRPNRFTLQALDLLDDFSTEAEGSSKDREHFIVINDPREDRDGFVRALIARSKYKDGLLDAEIASSRYFYANPRPNLSEPLDQLAAMGNWGLRPNNARASLRSVAVELARRLELT